ncbi:hypothetical protein RN001_001852 [Aquatica leii]|uniref:Uncharacterized protein n=1 Tax=Aquatica leii TaxID=1421715 RepID=A0AAN7PLN5_9COLE|nr:hypothetical protein RN001_001852 [Aquatica leii]
MDVFALFVCYLSIKSQNYDLLRGLNERPFQKNTKSSQICEDTKSNVGKADSGTSPISDEELGILSNAESENSANTNTLRSTGATKRNKNIKANELSNDTNLLNKIIKLAELSKTLNITGKGREENSEYLEEFRRIFPLKEDSILQETYQILSENLEFYNYVFSTIALEGEELAVKYSFKGDKNIENFSNHAHVAKLIIECVRKNEESHHTPN